MRKLTSALILSSLALGVAIPVLATTSVHTSVSVKVNDDGSTTKTITKTKTAPATLNLACIRTAVDKRETALIAATDTHHTTTINALKTRQASLNEAWGITDRAARRAAIKNAWKAFRTSWKTAGKDLRTARHNAWKTFNTDRKACGTAATLDDAGNEAADINV